MLDDKTVLVTGGTGSFGKRFIETVLRDHSPNKLIVFSRDELKQHEMRQRFPPEEFPEIRYFIGDVRSRDRLTRAFNGVDIVIHAAALKQVPACEYNPIEAVKTNIHGAENIINAALDTDVEKVLALSTDKAVNPVNLYGATKLVMEKLMVQANSYAGEGGARFACVRYGNVAGSRGSVIPLFRKQAEEGKLTITDERMTRFWITLDQGVEFVIDSLERMAGGEVFVPKIPSMNIMDLAEAIAPDTETEIIGIRPGEKIHEVLISAEESRHTREFQDHFIVEPLHPWWKKTNGSDGKPLPDGFSYSSGDNDQWLDVSDLRTLVDETTPAPRV